jgi:hypothetical protein
MQQDPRQRSRFYAPDTAAPPTWLLERQDVGTYRVAEKIQYLDADGFTYDFPLDLKKNTTDLASIPWFLTWLVPRDGRHTPAAIMHDSFIGGMRDVDYATNKPEGVSDEHADYLFREAMKYSQVGYLRRWIMWAAVSLRTMTLHRDTERVNWTKAIPVAFALVGWALVAAVLALDVPDFEHSGWHLPWFGNRVWHTEIFHGLAVIAASGLVFAVLFGAILRRRRSPQVGAIAGQIVGFFGLPMIAAALGWGGYQLLDLVVSRLKEGHNAKPVTAPATPRMRS